MARAKYDRETQPLIEPLTGREREILNLIASEMTSIEIAEALHIEPSTVDTHRKHLIQKLNVKSSIGLVKYALIFNQARNDM